MALYNPEDEDEDERGSWSAREDEDDEDERENEPAAAHTPRRRERERQRSRAFSCVWVPLVPLPHDDDEVLFTRAPYVSWLRTDAFRRKERKEP